MANWQRCICIRVTARDANLVHRKHFGDGRDLMAADAGVEVHMR